MLPIRSGAGLLLVFTTAAIAGCSSEPQAAAATSPAVVERVDAAAAVPHGDHNPHHGGTVFMTGDLHFEVVLDREGRHRIFFSDSTRADLPASVASSVAIVVTHPDGVPEPLAARIDDAGESWRADGQPVSSGEATARVSFDAAGEPYWIDIPFLPAAP